MEKSIKIHVRDVYFETKRSDKLIKGVTTVRGHRVETGKSVTLPYVRNTEKSPQVSGFQQNIEPAGRYMLFDEFPDENPLKGWEKGEMVFKKPLVLPLNNSDGIYDENSWKMQLFTIYKKKGKALSRALKKEGFDGIITIRKGDISEIVDLTNI